MSDARSISELFLPCPVAAGGRHRSSIALIEAGLECGVRLLVVSSDGRGVVSHAGSRLLADLADATGLTGAFTDAPRRLR
ncbi:hypothetical protein, partial [Streptomyces rubiginosohelvolus]